MKDDENLEKTLFKIFIIFHIMSQKVEDIF